ncbi:hypothetical protein SAY86_016244 [Trapa natans]|uniref:F-box domain-containing protein n=1 Tax=Trapa natans TaxID=22666 RepID=A0AAN7L961_TRANT|nr:hypothetical protein SAY86_016244 [Trapa natans]
MERLPGDCVSALLSKTSPRDVGRLSAASSTFRSAAESEALWEKFLPSNHLDIVARSEAQVKFSTKKELFFGLCNPRLVDNGRKARFLCWSFKLERPTGRISYILSARELSITWSNDPMYWAWISMTESRFQQVVELRTIHWLEIGGRIRIGDLSPSTNYAAYLIMKLSSRAYGLDAMPSETSVQVGDRVLCSELAYLQGSNSRKQGMEMQRKKVNAGDTRVPYQRADGWMEIHLGEFFTAGGHEGTNEEVKASLKEVKGYQLKGGLVVEGIEFRPILLKFKLR